MTELSQQTLEAIDTCYERHTSVLNQLKHLYEVPDDQGIAIANPVTGEDVDLTEHGREVFRATLNMVINLMDGFPYEAIEKEE